MSSSPGKNKTYTHNEWMAYVGYQVGYYKKCLREAEDDIHDLVKENLAVHSKLSDMESQFRRIRSEKVTQNWQTIVQHMQSQELLQSCIRVMVSSYKRSLAKVKVT